jgi:L-ascorbate metabolism protein UlaG (beta-lactamase superfamily)
MELTYLGLSCIRLRGKDATVLVDPPETTLPGMPKAEPDIVVRTDGVTAAERLRPRDGQAQEVSGPGEYEVRGVSVLGLPAGSTTIMRVEVDDVRVAALGRLDRQLTEEEIDDLGRIDILVVPVGGVDALSAVDATKLVNALEPAIVVPVRYRANGVAGTGGYEPVDKFAKEMGLADGAWVGQPKLNLTGQIGSTEDTRVVILDPRV